MYVYVRRCVCVGVCVRDYGYFLESRPRTGEDASELRRVVVGGGGRDRLFLRISHVERPNIRLSLKDAFDRTVSAARHVTQFTLIISSICGN